MGDIAGLWRRRDAETARVLRSSSLLGSLLDRGLTGTIDNGDTIDNGYHCEADDDSQSPILYVLSFLLVSNEQPTVGGEHVRGTLALAVEHVHCTVTSIPT